MSSNVASVAKNLILFQSLTSGSVSFATGATAATVMIVNVTAPNVPVAEYCYGVRNNATQTTIKMTINNTRPLAGVASAAFFLTQMSYTTGQLRDILVEGTFAGNASAVQLVFSLGSAATAAEVISADYQIWAYR